MQALDIESGDQNDVVGHSNVCGACQFAGCLAIATAACGAVIWSIQVEGYSTSEYVWVDSWRMGVARAIGSVLTLLYGQATLYNHLSFVDFALFARPCADPDSAETTEGRWSRTPTESRGAAVSAGGWAVCLGITLVCMTFFEPGCQRGLCVTVALWCCWWQVVWYGAMLGRVDVDDERKLPWKNWFLSESMQEIVMVALCVYFVYFAGKGEASLRTRAASDADAIRTCFLRSLCALLMATYGLATMCKPTLLVKDLAKPLFIEGSDPDEIWRNTPTASKHSAKISGGWAFSFALTVFAMTFLEPGCERGLCKCFALAMLWWQCVWYTAMLNRVDFNDAYKRPWTNWLVRESPLEIVILVISGYLGFIAE